MPGGSSNPFWKRFLAVVGIPSAEGPHVLVVSAEMAPRRGPASGLLVLLCSVACWMDAGACCLLGITFCLCISSPQYLCLVWRPAGNCRACCRGSCWACVQCSHRQGRAKWSLLARERVLLRVKVTLNSRQYLRQAWRGTMCTT